MKTNITRYLTYISPLLSAVLVAACSSGSTSGSNSDSGANTGSLNSLSMVAPSSYPAGIVAMVPVVVTNNGATTINNLSYAIESASNTTGAQITVDSASAASCRIIAAHASCTLNANIAATPVSHPGSFGISTSQGALATTNKSKTLATVLSVNVNIGLVQPATNSSSGADGLNLYYPSSVVGNPNGPTQIIVTAVVTSANAGAFNTIQLVDANGNLLDYSILTGNSGTGMTDLAVGSIVSFLVTIPSGSTQVQFSARTAQNGEVVSTATNPNIVIATNPAIPTGIMSVLPNYFDLTTTNESQAITLSNSGNGPISSLSFAPSSPLTMLSNTCGASLESGATCQYVVKFDKNIPQAGTSNVVVNYNDGSSAKSSTATVNYAGIAPVAGLTITSDNPNFDFSTSTESPRQTAVVTLTNSGTGNISGFSFTSLASGFSTNVTGLSNPCSPSTVLAPTATCSVNLVYNNNVVTPQTTDDITVNYKFGSNDLSASDDIAVTYETVQSPSPTPTGKIIFITSYGFNGDLMHGGGSSFFTDAATDGFAGADRLCESVAALGTTTAPLHGHWKALLNGNNATVLGREYRNTNGTSLGNATSGNFKAGAPVGEQVGLLGYDESSVDHTNSAYIQSGKTYMAYAWTGAGEGAECIGVASPGVPPLRWSGSDSRTPGNTGDGNLTITSGWWTNRATDCSGGFGAPKSGLVGLYCVQQ